MNVKNKTDPSLSKEFFSEDGLTGFVRYLDGSRSSIIPEPIYTEGARDGVQVELALQYNDSYNENIHSYVNNINTIEGGTHVSGFRRALTRTFKAYGDRKVCLKGQSGYYRRRLPRRAYRSGFSQVPEPQFEGQTKTKLGNSEVLGIVDTIASEGPE